MIFASLAASKAAILIQIPVPRPVPWEQPRVTPEHRANSPCALPGLSPNWTNKKVSAPIARWSVVSKTLIGITSPLTPHRKQTQDESCGKREIYREVSVLLPENFPITEGPKTRQRPTVARLVNGQQMAQSLCSVSFLPKRWIKWWRQEWGWRRFLCLSPLEI